MLKTVIERANMRELLDAARAGTRSKAEVLAVVPLEVGHFASSLDTLREMMEQDADMVRQQIGDAADHVVSGQLGSCPPRCCAAACNASALRRAAAPSSPEMAPTRACRSVWATFT